MEYYKSSVNGYILSADLDEQLG